MLVAVLNYLYHPVLSRIMDVARFGEAQVLFSLYMQAATILSVFGMVVLHKFANEKERDDMTDTLSTLVLYIMGSVVLVLLLLTPHLTRLWDLETPAEVLIVAATLVIATLANHGRFYLQATRRFTELSIANTIAAGGRLLFATLLVIIGWNAFGALAGLFIGTLLAFIYTFVKTKHIVPLPRFKKITKITWGASLGREMKYAALVLFATGFVTLLYTTDVEIIKYFFPPDIAGYYSGIATVARSIFFATGSVAAVLLVYINIHATKKENQVYLFKALAITALLGGGACIVMLLVPNLIVHLLIGSRYLTLAPMLPLLALHTLVVALINVFMFYFLALRTMILIPIATVGVGCIGLLLFFFHASPTQVVTSLLIGSIASLIMLIVTYYNHGRK